MATVAVIVAAVELELSARSLPLPLSRVRAPGKHCPEWGKANWTGEESGGLYCQQVLVLSRWLIQLLTSGWLQRVKLSSRTLVTVVLRN